MGKMLTIRTASRVVDHLGKKLYSSTPPALAELIANSYDAYATEVNVVYMQDEGAIIIADNGFGMTVEDIEEKYLFVGKEKQPVKVPINFIERPPMGKKGIGKYAAFSIGREYSIYTKTKKCDEWNNFKLDFNELNTDDETKDVELRNVVTLPECLEKFENDSGTIIVINKLIRNFTVASEAGVTEQFKRRFYLMDKFNFKFNLQGEEVSLAENDYIRKLQYIGYFGYSEEEFLSAYNIEKTKDQTFENLSSYINTNISGWMGTAKTPKDIKNENFDFANVAAYYNGKLADEDLFKNHGDARVASSYLIGEIIIDNVDFINGEDPIISSRQGLNEDDEKVKEIINDAKKLRSLIISKWDEVRAKHFPPYLEKNKSFNKWFEELETPKKKHATKLLNSYRVSNEIDEDTSVTKEQIDEINNIIQFVEKFDHSKVEASKIDTIEKMNAFVIETIDINTIDYLNAIRSRVKILEMLEKLLAEHGKESEFEDLIKENIWLISERWYIDGTQIDQQYNIKPTKDSDWKKSILDLVVFDSVQNQPILIELKRAGGDTAYEHPDKFKILKQCDQYRKALKHEMETVHNLTHVKSYKEIKAYFIAQNKRLDAEDIEELAEFNIEYLTYSQFITENKAKLSGYYESIQESKKIPQLKYET